MATPLTRPHPESDPNEELNDPARREEVAKQATAGLAALGMVYGGLNSFGEWGHLFGEYGEAAARPFEAVREYVNQAKGIMRHGFSGGSEARAALASEAERRSKRNEAVQDFARRNTERADRVKGYARVFAKAQREAGITRMAQDVSRRNMSDPTPGRRPPLDVDYGFNEELPAMGPASPERPDTRFGSVSDARRALLLTARAEAQQVLPDSDWDARRAASGQTLEDEVHALRQRARQSLNAQLAIPDKLLSEGGTTFQADLTGNEPTWDDLFAETGGAEETHPDAFDEVWRDKPQQRTGDVVGKTGGVFPDRQSADNTIQREIDYEDRVTGAIRRARRAMDENARQFNRMTTTSQDLHDEELRQAYRAWYRLTNQKSATPPGQMSVEAIRLRTRFDGSFRDFVETHSHGPKGSSQKGIKNRSLLRSPDDLTPGGPVREDQGPARPDQARAPLNYIDPMKSTIMQDSNMEAMGGRIGGELSITELYHHDRSDQGMRGRGRSWMQNATATSDQLAKMVRNQMEEGISQLNNQLGPDAPKFEFDLRKIDIDAHHQAYQFSLSKGGQRMGNVNVPLPSEHGSYKLRADQAAFFHPSTQLSNNDLFKDTKPMSILRAQRGHLVARPDEIALMNMHSFMEKLMADLRGGRESGAVKRVQTYAVERHFEQKSIATDSPEQNALKAREQRSATEMLFRELQGDKQRRKSYEQGIESVRRLRHLFESGQNYFSADTEFVSRDMRMERGMGGRAKVPFELASSVVNPNKNNAEASILYRADLREMEGMTGAEKTALQYHKDEARRIYQDIGGLSEEKTNRLMQKMESGGQLEITVDGERIDLLADNADRPQWVPNRREGEKLGSYYLRVQNAMMNQHDASFAVGQNYTSSEGTAFDLLAEKHGVNLHHAHKANVIDTMEIAKVLTTNDGNSVGLSSIMDALFDIGSSKERREVQEQFEAFGRARETGRIEPDAVDPFKNRLNSDGQKRLFDRLAQSIPQGSDTNFHSASFDEMVTSRVVMPELFQFIKSQEGIKALDRSRDALDLVNQFAGRRKFADRHSEMNIGGGMGEDNQLTDGLNPFVQNATAASYGRGVLFGKDYLPFQRLQNPVRQLYQRMKFKKLHSKNPIDAGEMVDMGGGKRMMRRGRGPGNDMLNKLRYQDEMGKARNVGQVMEESYGSRSFGHGVAVDSQDQKAPAIFAGFGSATRGQRLLYGGHENEASVGVTSRVAYTPQDAKRTWESQMQITAARAEAMRTKGQVKQQTVGIEVKDIDLDDMNKWVYDQAKAFDERDDLGRNMRDHVNRVTDPMDILDERKGTNVDTNLRQAYVLRQLLSEAEEGVTSIDEEGRKTMQAALDQRLQAAQGQGMSEDEILRERFDQYSRGEIENVGGRQPIIRAMGGESMVLDTMKTPSNAEILGVDVQFRQQQDRSAEMIFSFLEPQPDIQKELALGAKVSAAGRLRGPQAGMAGEQAVIGADMFKLTRRDFASALHVQISRLHDEAVAKMSNATNHQERQQVLNRFTDSLHGLTGGKMSKERIRSEVVQEFVGGKQYADYFEVDFTPEFTRAVEEGASTTRIMEANKRMGRSMADVFQHGSAMLQARDGTSKPDAEKRVANLLKQQVSNEIKSIKNLENTSVAAQIEGGLIGNGPKGQQRKQSIDRALKVLYKQQEALNNLFDGQIRSNQALSDLSEHGSLWDMFVDANDDSVMTVFRALAPSGNMQGSAVGGTGMGDVFESGSGRATLSKRSSLMTSALIGHSASSTLGGGGRRQQMASEMFKGWLAAQSGAAVFADSKLQRQIFEQLQSEGVRAKDVYDPSRIERVKDEASGKTTVMYRKKNDEVVPLASHLEDRFTWNDDGMLEFRTESGAVKVLEGVNPYTNRLETRRRQSAVVGMVTGKLDTTGGNNAGGNQKGKDRVLRVVFGEETDINKGQINANDFHKLFGQETRARQYYQHEEGKVPDASTVRSFDRNYVYFGEDARPIGMDPDIDAHYGNTLFSEEFDFISVDMSGDVDAEQSRVIKQMMKESGMSSRMLDQVFLGDEDSVVRQIMEKEKGEDGMSERQVRNMVRTARQMHGDGAGAQVLIPTRTGALAPTEDQRGKSPDGERVRRANVQAVAQLADLLGDKHSMDGADVPGPIQQLNRSVQAIHREAEAIREAEAQRLGQDVTMEDALSTARAKKRMRQVIRAEVQNDITSHNLMEAEDFFGTTLRQSMTMLMKQMEDMDGTYLGGEFKISSTQVRFEDKFRGLAGATEAHQGMSQRAVTEMIEEGPTKAFRSEVESMLREASPRQVGTEMFDRRLDTASKDLFKYIVQQEADFGGDVHRWRGMGVDEGFISRENARQATQNMISQQEGFDRLDNKTTSKTDRAERRAMDNIKEFTQGARNEIAMAQQELNRPGSTLGLLFGTARFPDFQNLGGYGMSRMSVLGSEALRVLGADPNHVHAFSHPLSAEMRYEDFDFDLNYLFAIDDAHAAATIRETRATQETNNLMNISRLLQEVRNPELFGVEGGHIDAIERETDTISVDGRSVSAQRLTSKFGGDDVFGDNSLSFMAAPGMALDAVQRDDLARKNYALQKAIVGQMGAYAKQGALNTRIQGTAYTDAMTRLVQQEERMIEAELQQRTQGRDLTKAGQKRVKQEVEGDVSRYFDSIFGKSEHKQGSSWEGMKSTFQRYGEMLERGGFMGHDLHAVAITDSLITENVAIYKYKSGRAESMSSHINNIMQTLHGNHSGGFESFDEAFDALMDDPDVRENTMVKVERLFGDYDGTQEEKMERAREGYRLRYDQHRAMRNIASVGIENTYQTRAANINASDIDVTSAMAASSPRLMDGHTSQHLSTQAVKAVAEGLEGHEFQSNMSDFFATSSWHTQSLADVTRTNNISRTRLADRLPNSGSVAAVGAAAMAVTAMAGAARDDTSMGQQQDMRRPSYAVQGQAMSQGFMQQRDRAAQNQSWHMRPQQGGGISAAASRPAPVRSSY